MVVLEHGHRGEVVAVGIGTPDGKGVFLGKAEAGCGFAGSGEARGGTVGGVLAEDFEEGGCPESQLVSIRNKERVFFRV